MTSWPHAPHHAFNEKGTYMITSATYGRALLFQDPKELDFLQGLLFELAEHYRWNLEAWAIFPNHYHFIAQSPYDPNSMKMLIKRLHGASSRYLNKMQNTPGRKVWFECWDSRITFSTSYMARLHYVIQNPVKHKIVDCATAYQWCSASWFEKNTSKVYHDSITGFKTDILNIEDDF